MQLQFMTMTIIIIIIIVIPIREIKYKEKKQGVIEWPRMRGTCRQKTLRPGIEPPLRKVK